MIELQYSSKLNLYLFCCQSDTWKDSDPLSPEQKEFGKTENMGAATSAPATSVGTTPAMPSSECPAHKQEYKSQSMLSSESSEKKAECPVQHNTGKLECPVKHHSTSTQSVSECPASASLQQSIVADDIDPTNMVS